MQTHGIDTLKARLAAILAKVAARKGLQDRGGRDNISPHRR